LKKIKAKDISVSVLAVTKRHREGIEKNMPEGVLTPFYRISHENIRNFVKYGIRVLVSTDAGIEHPIPARRVAHHSGRYDRTAGEARRGSLQCPLRARGTGDGPHGDPQDGDEQRCARVQASRPGDARGGKIGDLVILDADPLQSARNYRRISTVIKDGKVVDLGALPAAPLISAKTKS
jgi:hypothetical protein